MVDPKGDNVFPDGDAGVLAELAGEMELADAVFFSQVVKRDLLLVAGVKFFYNCFYMFGGSESFAALFLCSEYQSGEDRMDMVGDLNVGAVVSLGDEGNDGLHVADQPAGGVRGDCGEHRERGLGESPVESMAAAAVKMKPYEFPFATFGTFVIVVAHAMDPEDISLFQEVLGSVAEQPAAA